MVGNIVGVGSKEEKFIRKILLLKKNSLKKGVIKG